MKAFERRYLFSFSLCSTKMLILLFRYRSMNRIYYAIPTNVLTASLSGKSVNDYKEFKGLHKENLRDNMTDIELTLRIH